MAKRGFRTIPQPASQTDEGRERLRVYWLTLGEFIDNFAKVETATHLALRWYTRTQTVVAKAVFSGVRADAAVEYLRRLAEAAFINASEWTELEPVLNQLRAINAMRNRILHEGAEAIAEGRGFTTNALRALTEQRITAFPISPEILAAMTRDLRKIFIHLAVRHSGRVLRGAHPELDEILRASWQYKPPQPLRNRRPCNGSRKASGDSPKSSPA
jgi:hypothetical protein